MGTGGYGPGGTLTWDEYVAQVNPSGRKGSYWEFDSKTRESVLVTPGSSGLEVGTRIPGWADVGQYADSGTIVHANAWMADREHPGLSDGDDERSPFSKTNLVAELVGKYPWAKELGFLDLIKRLAVEDATADQIVAEVRASDQYKKQFPGFSDLSGVRRFRDEAEYLRTRDDLRQVLKDFGVYDPATDSPMDYVAFFDAGIDANELTERFGVYRELERGSQELRDAFYVYGGLDVTVDDLFQAVVSPQFRQELQNEYDRSVAAQPLDYGTYIERAREVSTARVVETMERLRDSGAMTGAAVSKVLQMDPAFGQQLMAALFTGGTAAAGTGTLSLDQLTRAYEHAVLGAAASEAGWAMPSRDRLEEFRQAGIQSSTLRSAYEGLSLRSDALTGMVQRANRGASMTQDLYERELLGQTAEIRHATAAENALGARAGGFAAAREGRRFAQPGRRVAY